MSNARFWIWVNDGRVKLTLKPGDERAWFKRYATDEGWSSESLLVTFDGETVEQYVETDGRDCDGRFSTQQTVACPVESLRVRPVEIDGETWLAPDWQRRDSSQRDYSAEAMGY